MAKWSFKDLFWRAAEPPLAVTEPFSSPSGPPTLNSLTNSSPPRSRREPGACLDGLRDVPGVVGSVAMTLDGALLGRDLPQQFDAAVAERLGARLVQMREALVNEGDVFETATLRYQNYDLHVGQVDNMLLGVLTNEAINLPALSMALKLVGRKLSSLSQIQESQ